MNKKYMPLKDILKGAIGISESILNINVDSELAKTRLKICAACEELNPISNRCRVCGCFLKHKTRLVKESCPKYKW